MLLGPICQLILAIFGWTPPTEWTQQKMITERIVIVISHTSYWDFFILLLYRFAYIDLKNYLHVIMKPQPFELWGWLLINFNCIPATRSEDSGEGFVQKTVDRFRPEKKYGIIIAPKGKTAKSKWRTGHYYLRQGLQADIAVAGIDYELKTLYLGPIHKNSDVNEMDIDDMNEMLKFEMGQIVPLNINQASYRITRPYYTDRISLINWTLLLTIMMLVILLLYIIYSVYRRKL